MAGVFEAPTDAVDVTEYGAGQPIGPSAPQVVGNQQPVNVPPTPPAPPVFEPPATATDVPPVDALSQDLANQPPPEPDMFDRLGNIVQKRADRMERAAESYEEDRIGLAQALTTGFGSAVGALAELTGEVAFSVIGGMMPDQAKTYLKEIVAAGGSELMSKEVAQDALRWYNSLSKDQQDLMASIADIGLAAIPFGAMGKPLTTADRIPIPFTEKSIKNSVAAVAGDKDQLKNIILSQSRVAKERRYAQPTSPYEENILNMAVSLGIKGTTHPEKIVNKLDNEINRLTTKISKELKKTKIKYVSRGDVAGKIDNALTDFVAKNPEFGPDGLKKLNDAVSRAQDDVLRIALKEFDQTPAGLLKLRQRVDELAKKEFKQDIFEGVDDSREILSVIRNSINEQLQGTVKDVDIRAAMQRQHYAIEAKMNTQSVAVAAPPKTLIEKGIAYAEAHPFIAAGLAKGQGMLTGLPELVGTTGALALGTYGLLQPGGRRMVGQALGPVARGATYQTAEDVLQSTPETP